jgi:hypothetical protein
MTWSHPTKKTKHLSLYIYFLFYFIFILFYFLFFHLWKKAWSSISRGVGSKINLSNPDPKMMLGRLFKSMCGFLLLCFPLDKTPCTIFYAQRQCKKTIIFCTILHCVFQHLHVYKQSLDFNTQPSLLDSSTFQLLCLLACKSPDLRHFLYHNVSKLKDSLLSSLKNNTMQVLSPGNWNPPKKHVSREILQQVGQSEPAPTSAPWRMDDKWSGNNFLLDSSSLVNHGG